MYATMFELPFDIKTLASSAVTFGFRPDFKIKKKNKDRRVCLRERERESETEREGETVKEGDRKRKKTQTGKKIEIIIIVSGHKIRPCKSACVCINPCQTDDMKEGEGGEVRRDDRIINS